SLFHSSCEIRGGISDVDLAAGDVVRTAIECGGFGQSGYGVFRGSVRGRMRPRSVCADRAGVDDAATLRSLILHEADGFLRTEESSGQVDVHDAFPLFERQFFKRNG